MSAPDGVLLAAAAVIIAALAVVAVVALMRTEDTPREPGSQLDEWDRPRSTTDDGGWLP